MLKLPATTTEHEYIELKGGMDLLSPTLRLPPGVARDALNFEVSEFGGYRRIAGYERVDGRPNPSDATYIGMTVSLTGTINVGDSITGGTSGATGVVIYRNGGLVVFTKASGTFVVGEDVEVAAVAQGEVSSMTGYEDADDFDVRMLNLAADEYRSDIAAVPGSGQTRGVAYFGGTLYAWRDNAGATAKAIYKATPSGWTLVPFYHSVAFTAGSAAYSVGGTITQGGNSATVKRVCLESGTWSGGTAAGRLIITQPAPGNFAAGAAAGGGACTLSGANAAITMAAGGLIEHDYGTVEDTPRLYGIDGVGKAFEFDGDVFAPISTGNSPDVPKRVLVHEGHVLLGFGNSLQGSGTGAAHNWTALAGAFEIACDSDITVLSRLPGDQGTGAAVVGTEVGVQVLYGKSGSTGFELRAFEDVAGMKARTGRRLGQFYALDDRGLFGLSMSQAFGNFTPASLTFNIRPFVQARRNLATAALVNRELSQYRLFFSDGWGLYCTIVNGKMRGAMPVLFMDVVLCACQGETPDGAETAFFGSEDGMVFRMDSGTSFDGDAIEFDLTLPNLSQRSPRRVKRYRKATLEVQGSAYSRFDVGWTLAYDSTDRSQPDAAVDVVTDVRSNVWDAMTWDEFTWDGRSLAPSEVGLDGSGENISLRFRGSSDEYPPFTINSVILAFSPRRNLR